MSGITRAEMLGMIEVAEKATPGPWDGHQGVVTCEDKALNFGVRVIAATPQMRDDDALFIAQCSPDRIVPILRLALEALEAEDK